jgi:hypothetical protein
MSDIIVNARYTIEHRFVGQKSIVPVLIKVKRVDALAAHFHDNMSMVLQIRHCAPCIGF